MSKRMTLGALASICCWLWAGVAHGECNSSYFNPSPNQVFATVVDTKAEWCDAGAGLRSAPIGRLLPGTS